jgi:SNF2 family DNA or RNA helicase
MNTAHARNFSSDEIDDSSDAIEKSHMVSTDQIADDDRNVIPLMEFVNQFSDGLLDAVRQQNPAVYSGQGNARREAILEGLLRKPFPAQSDRVLATAQLLIDQNAPAGILNAEMGTGKTMMAIAVAAIMHAEGFQRTLVVSPPHLVYKWRREIQQTVPNARVWILNGPDTLRKLLQIRSMREAPKVPEFFILGRVRMRLGYHWRAAFAVRKMMVGDEPSERTIASVACCPDCQTVVTDSEGQMLFASSAAEKLSTNRMFCAKCHSPLWSLMRRTASSKSSEDLVKDAMLQIPTVGKATADRLLQRFGSRMLGGMLEDNVYEFINLMDDEGNLVFNDRQAQRIERGLSKTEFSFGEGGYQATEFIKRYLPQGYFGLLVVDEGHEYKNEGSAQGQAFGVLARKCTKKLLLTGTLMGGYADDLFYLLWRLDPTVMIGDGFAYRKGTSLAGASMRFMREHGIIKDIYKQSTVEVESHRTARGTRSTHRSAKGPGFGPKGIMRYVVPITAFLKLKEIGGNVLPPYKEVFTEIPLNPSQLVHYERLSCALTAELRDALRKGDHSLLGVVLNALLAWPDCAFREETVRHPHQRRVLAHVPAVFDEVEAAPKEAALIELCRTAKKAGRRVLAYTVYTGTRDTTPRLKSLLESQGFKVAVLRASVDAARREDWLFEQVDRGVDVVITNPELVKTGLDMLEFPTIVFMQSGYNVYTLQQAARRSWRIGQRRDVEVHFLGYGKTAQMTCLELMAKKIAVSQSTSGDVPESGLDALNQDGDSVEVALAKRLVSTE